MRSISASIVVLAGSAMVSVGALSGYNDIGMFVCLFGVVVTVIGLVGWFAAPIEK